MRPWMLLFLLVSLAGCMDASPTTSEDGPPPALQDGTAPEPTPPEPAAQAEVQPEVDLETSETPAMEFACDGALRPRLDGVCGSSLDLPLGMAGLPSTQFSLDVAPDDPHVLVFVSRIEYLTPRPVDGNQPLPKDIVFWMSSDAGRTWQATPLPVSDLVWPSPFEYGDFIMPRIHAVSAEHFILATRGYGGDSNEDIFVFESNDGGTTWTFEERLPESRYHTLHWVGAVDGVTHVLTSYGEVLASHPFTLHSIDGDEVRRIDFRFCHPAHGNLRRLAFGPAVDGRLDITCGTDLEVDVLRPATIDLREGTLAMQAHVGPSGCEMSVGGRIQGRLYVVGDSWAQLGSTGPDGTSCDGGLLVGGASLPKLLLGIHPQEDPWVVFATVSAGVPDPWGGSLLFSSKERHASTADTYMVAPGLYMHRLTWDGETWQLDRQRLAGGLADGPPQRPTTLFDGDFDTCQVVFGSDGAATIGCGTLKGRWLFRWEPV